MTGRARNVRRQYTEAEALDAIRKLATQLGRTPTQKEWELWHEGPSRPVLVRMFGSWTGALARVGLQPRPRGRPRTLTADGIDQRIVQRLHDGDSIIAVAEDLGVARSTVRKRAERYLQQHDLPPLQLATGRPSAEELEAEQLTDPAREYELRVRGHAVEFERAEDGGWGAHVPTLPGVIAVAPTRRETTQLIREAIVLHTDAIAEGDLGE